ncbi:MAG: restriction endonuclease [Butyrivibrio sp.]|jgi:restriction system protein|uniref:restriction endonuclease n=1 Tax=Butyrivibrio sp. VCB2001 TaxID=1280667 RepID=UPI0003FE1723|nr:restriction endonuclease [Butyrivibrio sp. VCB2001]MBO6197501.1 restriction endonuclease [Butyrivibrio sp.]
MTQIPVVILYLILAIIIVLLVVLVVRAVIKRLPHELPMDEMEGHDFEYYCADLLKANGFLEVEVTKGSGDFGADILAEKDGITYAVQCKCYDKPIGVKAVQEVYAGRDYYDRMVGVVMTNQYFTQPAVELARKLNIMLWDRGYLDDMDKAE